MIAARGWPSPRCCCVAVAPPPGARPTRGAETEEARIADILQSALVKHGGEVNRCFEKALADTLDVSGKIELAVDVGDGGPRHQGGARERRREVAGAARLPDRERRDLDAGRHRPGQHRDRAAGVRGAGRAVLDQGQGRARSRSARAAQQEDRRAGAVAAVLGQAAGRRGDDARAEGGADAADDRRPPTGSRCTSTPGAEVLYVLKGHARILGPSGVAPEKLDEGMAILIPGGMPHAIENMGRTSSAVLLRRVRADGPGARLPRSEGRRRGARRSR